jgi:uncharacterized protein (DUF2235 family)
MAKNIVICCDGTSNEFGDSNTNVVKLYQMLVSDPNQQLVYYHPGLGTMGARGALTKVGRWWTGVLGLAFGYGITSNIGDCYQFLMDNFEDGDKVFLFGFSRGAYTARALGAMLHMFGLLRKGNDIQFPYAARMFKQKLNNHDFAVADEFKSTFSRVCKPYFVGVWDTVSSVGWIYDPVRLPFTTTNPDIGIGRHAISIDERRCMYRQNLWGTGQPHQDLKQVWFAGVHSDVGGGYPEPQSSFSKVTLKWMLREAKLAGLLTRPEVEELFLEGTPIPNSPISTNFTFAKPDPTATPQPSLRGWWWLLELCPKQYQAKEDGRWVKKWKIPLGRRRVIPDDSLIHVSVEVRKKLPGYDPKNLPKGSSYVS